MNKVSDALSLQRVSAATFTHTERYKALETIAKPERYMRRETEQSLDDLVVDAKELGTVVIQLAQQPVDVWGIPQHGIKGATNTLTLVTKSLTGEIPLGVMRISSQYGCGDESNSDTLLRAVTLVTANAIALEQLHVQGTRVPKGEYPESLESSDLRVITVARCIRTARNNGVPSEELETLTREMDDFKLGHLSRKAIEEEIQEQDIKHDKTLAAYEKAKERIKNST